MLFTRPSKPLTLLALCAALLACANPFATREPEPPKNSGSRYVPPFAAEIVLTNMRNAISDLNVENYLRCFADSTRTGERFRFEPDAATSNQYPGVFNHWSLSQERDYFSQLRAALPTDSLRSLRLDSLQTITFNDSAQFARAYELNVRHKQQSSGVPGQVRGELRFWLRKDQLGEWSIYRWADFATGQAQTWSALKAAFVR
jgi:hypothetical protein